MIFRYRDGVLPNLLATGYSVGGYLLGLYLITRDAAPALVTGTLLLAHAMIIAAYYFHECAHNTVFASNAANARLGNVLIWICGGIYCRYEELLAKAERGALAVGGLESEELELAVLRVLLMARPGDEVRFEESFQTLLRPMSESEKLRYDRTLEAWVRVSQMIDTR